MAGKSSHKIFHLSKSVIAIFILFSLTISNIPGTFAALKPTNLLATLAQASANNVVLPQVIPSPAITTPTTTNTSSERSAQSTFQNPIVPWLNPHSLSIYLHTDGLYYLASIYPPANEAVERGQSIFVMSSPNLHDWTGAFEQRKTVFNLSSDLNDRWMFGVKLQHLNGGWYIYFTMEVDEKLDTSRQFVIGAESGPNPMQAEFGPAIRLKVPGSPDDSADLSGRVMEYGPNPKELYFIWRRLPYQKPHNLSLSSYNEMGLYIAPMASPTEISGPAVQIKDVAGTGFILGGGYLHLNARVEYALENDPIFLFFMPRDGCIQLLKLDHGFHPLVEENWKEVPNEKCALATNEKQGVFNIKLEQLVPSPDGSQTWLVYSASDTPTEPWKRRTIRADRIAVDRQTGVPVFPRPAGLKISQRTPKNSGRRPSVYPVSTHPGAPDAAQLPSVLPGSGSSAVRKIKPGGLGEAREPSDHVTDLVRRLAPQIHAEVCKKLGAGDSCQTEEHALSVIQYKSQMVSGTNYFVKVRRAAGSESGQVWHLVIYEQTWTDTLELSRIEGPKEKTDEIGYF